MTDEELANALARRLLALGPASRFHLETAVAAMEHPHAWGKLEILVPKRKQDHLEVRWLGGVSD